MRRCRRGGGGGGGGGSTYIFRLLVNDSSIEASCLRVQGQNKLHDKQLQDQPVNNYALTSNKSLTCFGLKRPSGCMTGSIL